LSDDDTQRFPAGSSSQIALARERVNEVIETDAHAPAFDRKRNRVWLRQAKKLRGKISP